MPPAAGLAGGTGAQYADRPWLDPDAAPFIRIQGVSKRFGAFTAVGSVDLDIYRGELFSLLGGSGCGKTTLLRMLAGFEIPSGGSITIDGADMTDVPAYRRPVNMMFQSYALFPHMNVESNVAYGLKRDGVAKAEIAKRVGDILEMVELRQFGKRKPHQLSGGQRQRVALARALVKQPKVLLLDEPLGALDKRLREQTQFELMKIQDQLGITFIVVTHDQEEAMTLSTRIAVMDAGNIIQVGEPSEVYERPKTRKIANFIGTINTFEGNIAAGGKGGWHLACPRVREPLRAPKDADIKDGQKALLAIRPEKITMSKSKPGDDKLQSLRGEVLELAYMGNLSIYRVRVDGGQVVQVTAPNLQRTDRNKIDWEDRVYLSWRPENSLILRD
ncbi:MAG: ABC transporter ATP-binding protein [Gammaproteobacteria bacterium]|nr:ABC transporter ATP-binding protein [Gammaproteobacteria bacterium]MDA8007819.1 ABC transporter ATP-binding protein [Gammaproteobacteria bacterium]MDA8012022.1 ABC transporter ATP-binding protein [Gammaproteobacteria bacterium]